MNADAIHYVVLLSAYAAIWFVAFFCLLPIGLGDVDPETGAPIHPRLKPKALAATLIAAVAWAIFYAAVGFGWLEV